MKNKSIVWMLAALGLIGCTNDSKIIEVESDADKTIKADTALVLRATTATVNGGTRFLLVNKDGTIIEATQWWHPDNKTDIFRYSTPGDTVLIAGARPDSVRIVRNLTMEKQIKAFSRQK